MKTTIYGRVMGVPERLTWDNGTIEGTPEARARLLELKGNVRAGPQWPILFDPDLTRHLDFVVCAMSIMGMDAHIEGDVPDVPPIRPGGVA